MAWGCGVGEGGGQENRDCPIPLLTHNLHTRRTRTDPQRTSCPGFPGSPIRQQTLPIPPGIKVLSQAELRGRSAFLDPRPLIPHGCLAPCPTPAFCSWGHRGFLWKGEQIRVGMERQEAAFPKKGGLNHGEMETGTPAACSPKTRVLSRRHMDTHTCTPTHMCADTHAPPLALSTHWHAQEHPDTLVTTHRHKAPRPTRARTHPHAHARARKTVSRCAVCARTAPSRAAAPSANRSCVPMILRAAPQLPHRLKS